MLLSQILTTQERDVASLGKFLLVVQEEIVKLTDGKDAGWMDGRIKNVALAHAYHVRID